MPQKPFFTMSRSNQILRKIVVLILSILILYSLLLCTAPPPPPSPESDQNRNETQIFSQKINRHDGAFVGPRDICGCPYFGDYFSEVDFSKLAQSTCSAEATLAGPNQTVFTYSFYEGMKDPHNRNYFEGIKRNLNGVHKFYPGAVMRLYSNASLVDGRHSAKQLCGLICDNENFYYCPIQQIKQFDQLHLVHPMIWRFLPLGDPMVAEFNVRDLDSRISQREVDAVWAWRKSHFAWHGMRDHPYHCVPILGGGWGGNNHRIGLFKAKTILNNILEFRDSNTYGIDQLAIAWHIYAPFYKEILSHDAYCCATFPESVPFPTRRVQDDRHVVQVADFETEGTLVDICPPQCRPKDGHDWERC